MMRQQRKGISEILEGNHIEEETWVNYLTDLFKQNVNPKAAVIPQINIEINDDIKIQYSDVEKL